MKLHSTGTPHSRLGRATAVAPFEAPIVTYLCLVGTAALVTGAHSTPNTLDDALPGWMVVTWALFLAVGGALACIGLFRNSPHFEAMGLVFLCWPCSLYAVVLGVTAGGAGVAAVLAYLALLTGCILRLRVLYVSNHARRVATRLISRGGSA